MYDKNNIFAKIIRGEAPATKIYEDDNVVCFEDANKSAPIHWLVVPKTEDSNFSEFVSNNSSEVIGNFFKVVDQIIKKHKLDDYGYRLISNCGANVGQSIFHFHLHILSGKKLSPDL